MLNGAMNGSDDNTVGFEAARGRGGRCPICGKPTQREVRPFCSRRCADVDLGRWLGGVYRIGQSDPDAEPPDGGDEGAG